MINKSMEDRYPMWLNEEQDTDLDNMLVDILNDQLNERFWDGVPRTEGQKRKYQVRAPAVPDTVDESPSTKRKKNKESVGGCEASEMVCTKCCQISCRICYVAELVCFGLCLL